MTLQYGFGIGIIYLSMKPSLLFKNGIKIADDFFNGSLGLEVVYFFQERIYTIGWSPMERKWAITSVVPA